MEASIEQSTGEVIKTEVSNEVVTESNRNDENSVETDDDLERKHFQRIVNAFRSYKLHSLKRLYNSTKYISSLPQYQQDLLKNYRSHLDKVRVAIEHNYEIIKIIIKDVAHLFQNADHSNDIKVMSSDVTPFDMEKVQSIFKQLYREWSMEGKEERDASFKPILDEISERFPPDEIDCSSIRILVPGAGLGRLSYEIARKGYTCQGNEFSLFMLFTSNFVLNKCQGLDLYRIYPWVHQYYNNLKAYDQIQMVRFPDVDPCDLPSGIEFSMAAGSYIEIYKEPDCWDCIATCFFLDTANNVIDYIETTWNILKPGGYWINLGPLLYHHADVPNENSIEPSYEEIREIIVKFGFTILKEELNVVTPYSQNPRSMMCYEYKSVFFVCRKPEEVGDLNHYCSRSVAIKNE
ncbi:carnosine N-methyltransferase-like isoform X2 [Stegodyphus dumicola]|uniref:carnosine N-methyltransferase-like isoform X2 n=1 Tax=Stegodyphus dumicola TaxID=202533 RepID=UPI0015AB7454|nr:carnosine N-methyltransferase-like isoform X2 [Stegodyphus dumicola]